MDEVVYISSDLKVSLKGPLARVVVLPTQAQSICAAIKQLK